MAISNAAGVFLSLRDIHNLGKANILKMSEPKLERIKVLMLQNAAYEELGLIDVTLKFPQAREEAIRLLKKYSRP